MAVIRLSAFLGESRALHPMLLPANVGVTSTNQKPGRGDLRPWNAPLTKATVPGGRQTIYRMGRDVVSDTNYWFSWPAEVHVVCAPNAADTAERTYYSGGTAFSPKWTNSTLALASAPYPTAYRELGVPAPASACTLSASGGSSILTETRYYTYTYVTDIGEESAPNPSPAEIVCKSDDTIAVSSLAAPPSGACGINRIRVYRTQSGLSGEAAFFFAREIASTLSSTVDDGRKLQETLPSTTWLMPPADLSWLTGLWNGMMAGISGRSVRFCEATTFYAWPLAYEIVPTNAQPVALATYGQTLVMLTNGNPSIITGGTPDAMDEQPVEFCQACIAPLSAVGVGHGVVWASPDGLAYVGASGSRLLTGPNQDNPHGIMTRDDWQAINPGSIKGCLCERRYIGFYTQSGVRKGFVYDFSNPSGMYFLDFGFDALYLDDLQDALFVLDGGNVQKWDAGSPKTVTFKSKLFRCPKPVVGFACAQVVADNYPVTFKLYADAVLKHTQVVASDQPFRLPGGYYGTDFQILVETTGAIQAVAVAHSMRELAQAV